MSAPRRTPLPGLRRPVRREGAERYLLVTLVAFAVTVIGTRWFLELTGFPRIGGGDLHIAHALWGGVALFAAALGPILLAGRLVYLVSATLAGIGIGLFIDEVGKLITSTNDYFYPAAAPIIYATFLVAVLVWIRVRRRDAPDARTQLLTALELLEESVEGDLQDAERDLLQERLAAAAAGAPTAEQRRLAGDLLAFIANREIAIAPDRVDRLAPIRDRLRARADHWLGGRGLRILIVAALLVTGIGQVLAVFDIGSRVALDPAAPMTAFGRFQLIHLSVEAVAGALVVAGAVLVSVVGRHRLGWSLAYFGLLVLLTLGDLISFYIRQFDSILAVLGHLVLLMAVVLARAPLEAEPEARAR
jgi:hypothetical protein